MGTVVNYIVGVILFVIVAHSTVAVAISACVLPFIPTAIIKAVLACAIGLNIRKRIPGLKASSYSARTICSAPRATPATATTTPLWST